jgi:hypothetical protein
MSYVHALTGTVTWLNMPVTGLSAYSVRGGEFAQPDMNKRSVEDDEIATERDASETLAQSGGESVHVVYERAVFVKRVHNATATQHKRQAGCQSRATSSQCAAGGDVFTRVGTLTAIGNATRYAASTPPVVTMLAPNGPTVVTFGSAVQVCS